MVCKDMRPFAIVDDAGFCEIAQCCVSIGNFIFYSNALIFDKTRKIFLIGRYFARRYALNPGGNGTVQFTKIIRRYGTVR
jgi:hypothetical protein